MPRSSTTWFTEFLIVDPKYRKEHVGSLLFTADIFPRIQKLNAKELFVVSDNYRDHVFYDSLNFSSVSHSLVRLRDFPTVDWVYKKSF